LRWVILAACIVRLWLMPLTSSFWVDEMVTVFVVRHPGDPSFAPVPQVPASIYYWLPRLTHQLFGETEVSYRFPSVLAMGLALFLIGRIAARLIHPRAAWFAIFACLGLHGINYFAVDARPYGLGICVASLSVWLLIRWLDASKWIDGLAFVVAASLLWRIQLIYWPFYLVFFIYAAVRLARKETEETKAGLWQTAGLFGLLTISLVPVAINALALFHQASAHVISELPGFREFEHATRWSLVIICAAGTWLVARLFKWPIQRASLLSGSSFVLIAAWWLIQPVALYVFSRVTGDSVFITRYLSLALPGTALAATAAAAMFIPPDRWTSVSIALGAGVLLVMGQWTTPPWSTQELRHDNSDWRSAAREETRLATTSDMPIIVLSPFVEARPPIWTPDYPLPGFLYSHLSFYPLKGKFYLFPFGFAASDGEAYALHLTADTLSKSPRFVIYGANNFWRNWFAHNPDLKGWRSRLEMFGDVQLVVFDAP
jgi:mannosyltransferase